MVCCPSPEPSFLSPSFLQNLKKNVDERQAKLSQAKGEYKTALRNLEMISDEIHERRRSSAIGPRGRGVGAEGDSVSGDDISGFKLDTDGISSEFNCCTSFQLKNVYVRLLYLFSVMALRIISAINSSLLGICLKFKTTFSLVLLDLNEFPDLCLLIRS